MNEVTINEWRKKLSRKEFQRLMKARQERGKQIENLLVGASEAERRYFWQGYHLADNFALSLFGIFGKGDDNEQETSTYRDQNGIPDSAEAVK